MESELLAASMIGGNSARFEVDGSSNPYFVTRFSGVEAVSELYEFKIEVASRYVDVDELVGATAALRLAGVDRSPRTVHGIICRADYAGEVPPRSTYRITLVPTMWRMQFRRNSRIFQKMTTPAILQAVLSEAGVAFQARLAGSYAPRDYCVQYRESDLAFIRRLMEEDGIAFYFEHGESAHTVVLSDVNTGRVKIEGDPTLSFRIDEQIRGGEHVKKFSLGRQIVPGGVVVRDYDLYASQNVEARDQGRDYGQLELYEAPVGARDPGLAAARAKVRLEEARTPGKIATGTSDCARLVPGHSFTLAGHMRGELDGDYHVIRIVHRGEQPRIVYADAELVYDNEFVALPTETPYRPPRVTAIPSIRGVQTATVVGPAGEEIYVDEQARVKVQFHWDRAAPFDETSSCWVRVSQAWAGTNFGAMFIPRIGHEVLVEFIEGDPNRPIITGRIYDGTRTPPYPLPDEKTKSTIKSESSPGGGGFNELRFEDAKGAEEVFIHAQLDMNTVVLQDATRDVGRDDALIVRNNQSEDVLVDRSASVGNNETMKVGVDQSLVVGQHQTNVIGQNQVNTVGLNQASTIGTNQINTIGGDQTTTVHANRRVTVTGGQDTVVGGDRTLSVMGHHLGAVAMDNALAVGGNQHVQVFGTQTIEVGLDQLVTVIGSTIYNAGMMVAATIGADAIVTVGANHTLGVTGMRTTAVGGTDTLTVTGALTVSAATITLTAGASSITLSPSGISISTGGTVTIDGSLVTVNMGNALGGFF
ncbi:type VI secretion system Vgr family protein [Nannocystis punicea]|uniref:Type VI secretion system tip protein TssI/VgrG n=1 Tax=Nannocystis punicea TaxID=2995304 RepID=A0ABY7H6D3_9BACT|nr:type VI secretion system tip protein TssI/VgrG [Nannocystis poenicansa]WAS94539.1 type VI secretion system tip protein TssI/VgrG [Nannocystis poenicansa]